MSSPGTYWRCSANSTEKPLYGLLCRPGDEPLHDPAGDQFQAVDLRQGLGVQQTHVVGLRSTLAMAIRSMAARSVSAFAHSLSESDQTRPGTGQPTCASRQSPLDGRLDLGQQPLDDLVGRDAGRLGVERGDDAVPQHRQGHAADVLGGGVVAAVQDGPGLGRPGSGRCSRAARRPSCTSSLMKSGASLLAGPRRPGQVAGVLEHVVGHRHAADDLLEPQDVLARQRRAPGRPRTCR